MPHRESINYEQLHYEYGLIHVLAYNRDDAAGGTKVTKTIGCRQIRQFDRQPLLR